MAKGKENRGPMLSRCRGVKGLDAHLVELEFVCLHLLHMAEQAIFSIAVRNPWEVSFSPKL